MLYFTCPPLTRLSQLRGALGFGLGAAAWGQWQTETAQPLPENLYYLPLPAAADTLMAQYFQAWGKPQQFLQITPGNLSLDQLLLWGLGSSDQTWAKAGFLSPRPSHPNAPSSSPLPNLSEIFLGDLRQALHGHLAISPSLNHGLRAGLNSIPTQPAWASLSRELRGLLWGSLYGARYGWSCLPPLWIVKMPPELETLANQLLAAWAGQLGNLAPKQSGSITTAGYLYPR
ncbi:hypothetical protein [Synechococcus sp. PCC 6312]|uniref:hypothetical protein n=1 Tax=Synechococcus sp. (strain ATCC 27167 / PCC 6312) TaxID=195253 RepID=UPI00029ECEC0|nr:hypothetical protein [Synechococcus sp. PCC 6312]AFY62290.1 hypothetical protein Syn6312_3244 [Synechococcus sp. PCC 6312]